MTTLKTQDDNAQESTDDDLDHRLGGVSIDGAAMQVKNVEDGARVVVESLPSEAGDIVTLAIRSDTISGRAYLTGESAAAIADELATAAEEVDNADD